MHIIMFKKKNKMYGGLHSVKNTTMSETTKCILFNEEDGVDGGKVTVFDIQ